MIPWQLHFVKEVVEVLRKINPAAAEEFIRLYLGGSSVEDEGQSVDE